MSFIDFGGDAGAAPSSGGSGFGGGLSGNTFTMAGSAVKDFFAAMGDKLTAGAYDQAAGLADKQAQFTEESTRVKEFQTQREIFKTIGGQQAEVAGAGFAKSGSALDLLRDSASQGALAKEMVAQQGLITEEGYKEQAASYRTMASAARTAATGSEISGVIEGIGAVASVAAVFL